MDKIEQQIANVRKWLEEDKCLVLISCSKKHEIEVRTFVESDPRFRMNVSLYLPEDQVIFSKIPDWEIKSLKTTIDNIKTLIK